MRKLPLFQALAAAMLAAAASPAAAELTDAQLEEMNCIYSALSEDERVQLQYALYGSDEQAAAAEEILNPAIKAAGDGCAARYGWDQERRMAGEDYTLYSVSYEVAYLSLASDKIARLDALMSGFDENYAYTFTLEGQQFLPDYDAWFDDLEQRLIAAGVETADHEWSMNYLTALADVAMSAAEWEEWFAQKGQ